VTPATTFEEVRRRLEAHVPVQIGSEEAPRRAAVAAIFRQAEGPVPFELLFIRRSSRADDPWSGQMAFPGGRSESGDRTLLSTAIRETREEIGLDLEQDAQLLGRIDDVRASVRGKLLPMSITPFAFRLRSRSVRTVVSDEAQEVLWIPAPLLVDPDSRSTIVYEVEGQVRELPCIRALDRVVWGLTYGMVARLVELLDWPKLVRGVAP
jgi:8-oxo-dGTP pyrophosphatase MutT (NUDIX family)